LASGHEDELEAPIARGRVGCAEALVRAAARQGDLITEGEVIVRQTIELVPLRAGDP
jgi:hypothetical protein